MDRSRFRRRVFAVTLLAVLTPGLDLVAQDAEPPKTAGEDPYTRGEDEALEALGYERLHRFPLAAGHDTVRVEQDLGRVPICWIETAHFRLGCNLPEQNVPREREARDAMRAELKELGERLPRLRPRSVRKLDRWLRAHLFAQRLESIYADVQTLLGVTDADFPDVDAPFFRGEVPAEQRWMGRGPRLGVKGKFVVLLFDKEAACGRYLQTYTDASPEAPSRWYFAQEDDDCFVYATAAEYAEGAYQQDRAMHAAVTFNVVVSLLDAYRGYSYRSACWWTEGIAHRLRRAVASDVNCYSGYDGDPRRAFDVEDWGVKVRQRLEHDLVRPLGDIADITDANQLTLVDHWACWTRVEYLLDVHGGEALARFVSAVKGGVDLQGAALAPDQQASLQREAFLAAFGQPMDEFERAWAQWVPRHYR